MKLCTTLNSSTICKRKGNYLSLNTTAQLPITIRVTLAGLAVNSMHLVMQLEALQSKLNGTVRIRSVAAQEEHVDDDHDRVNIIRSKELAQTGAETVAVGCPFCSTMVTDGLSAIGSEMEVKDIAEIVWEQIKANDAAIEAKKAETADALAPLRGHSE